MGRIKALQERIIRKLDRVWTQKRVSFLWPILTHWPGWRGVGENNDEMIVISLTSFPARIGTVDKTIKSLLLQKKKPAHIVLWLASEQFPQKEKELPQALLKLKKFGLEIRWCDDIRSYKKLVPALEQFPEAIIVTADDDLYYRRTWLESLYNGYTERPKMVIAYRITKFYVEDGLYKTVSGGRDIWPIPSFLHKVTGCGGVLYPPHTLFTDVTKSEIFMKICPTNDDIWFWMMAVLNGTKICVPDTGKQNLELVYVPGTQEGPTLTSINDRGENLFWKDFNRMLSYYPELDYIFKKEYEELTGCRRKLS